MIIALKLLEKEAPLLPGRDNRAPAPMAKNPGPNDDYCARVKTALGKSLDVLGEPAKRALLYHLQERYKISLEDEGRCSSLEEIKAAMDVLLGGGSHIITNLVEKELGDLVNNKTGAC